MVRQTEAFRLHLYTDTYCCSYCHSRLQEAVPNTYPPPTVNPPVLPPPLLSLLYTPHHIPVSCNFLYIPSVPRSGHRFSPHNRPPFHQRNAPSAFAYCYLSHLHIPLPQTMLLLPRLPRFVGLNPPQVPTNTRYPHKPDP